MLNSTKGYSIWLIPEGKVYEELTDNIQVISKKFKASLFVPHVTLVGGVLGIEKNVVANTYKLATQIKSFTITLNKLGYQEFFFRSLFVYANLSPQLNAAYKKANRIYGIKSAAYMPHLSLVYANLNKEIKLRLIKKFGKMLKKQFKVKALYLYKTEGQVADWYEVARFNLN